MWIRTRQLQTPQYARHDMTANKATWDISNITDITTITDIRVVKAVMDFTDITFGRQSINAIIYITITTPSRDITAIDTIIDIQVSRTPYRCHHARHSHQDHHWHHSQDGQHNIEAIKEVTDQAPLHRYCF
jgi:hypothetical protein